MSEWSTHYSRPLCEDCGEELKVIGYGQETQWYCGGCDLVTYWENQDVVDFGDTRSERWYRLGIGEDWL